MRALPLLVVLAGLAGLVGLAGIVGAAGGPRGFDHTLHERDVIVAGGESIACAHCHDVDKTGRLVGKPGHAACFGACHGAPPTTPARGKRLALDADQLKLCTSCHAESLLAAPFTGRMPVPFPPYTIERDFNLALGHKQHAAAACTQCHDVSGSGARPQPHARCAGCHEQPGAKVPMTACSSCHPAAGGTPQPPELRPLQNSIGAIFSHARHAARSHDGRECTTCHAAILLTDATELPRPTAAECARCHDGAHAFATNIACTRCHAEPSQHFDVARPQARFSHSGPHAQLVADQPCSTCHALAANGDAIAPGHAACANAACHAHADDFGARKPKTCGACHLATEPWRHLRADRPSPDATEFGATLDHAKHPGDCTHCHARRTATAELQMPTGHAACAGVACHSNAAGSAGPSPRLDDCTACHAFGRAVARVAQRAADPWSVRAAFSHAGHLVGTCTSCHDDLRGADVVRLAAPTKPTCAPCHDGATAFSLTGTTCRKCHRQGAR